MSWALSSATRLVSANSVVDLSQKVGEKYGFELYRNLFHRFRGIGPEQGQRAMEEVLNPRRCRNALELPKGP